MDSESASLRTDDDHFRHELVWEENSYAAMKAHARDKLCDSITLWHRAEEASKRFTEFDPRQAATINNAGIALILDGHLDEAEETLLKAVHHWETARSWVQDMSVDGTARSSLFHLRLETKYRESFAIHIRNQFLRIVGGAEAVSRFNLGFLLSRFDRTDEGLVMIEQAISLRQEAFGVSNPELATFLRTMAELKSENLESRAYLEHARSAESETARNSLERWRDECPQEFTDERRVLSAVCLTEMLSDRDFQQLETDSE